MPCLARPVSPCRCVPDLTLPSQSGPDQSEPWRALPCPTNTAPGLSKWEHYALLMLSVSTTPITGSASPLSWGLLGERLP